jgi:predicted porin
MVGQVEVANGLLANSQDLTPVQGSEGIVLGSTANYDVAKYTSPAVMGFKATATAVRGIDATGDHTYILGAEGKVGPVTGKVDYTDGTERVRLSGSVTVMGLSLGAGWSGNEKVESTGAAVKDSWIVAAAMPVGPVTVGATYADGNGKATEVAAKYSLSKRTSVAVAYRDVTENSVAAKNVATTRVRLQHTF